MALHLVLVEPAGPLNVGSVARLCANFGVDSLRLVAPRCDPGDEEARRMAVGGRPLLARASRHGDLREALADCRRVVACSGRGVGEPLAAQSPQQALAWLLAGPGPLALVFGREDRGLSNDELLQAGRLLRIASHPDCPSLNLSHAVAVVLHELQTLRDLPETAEARLVPPPQAAAEPTADPCPRGELEAALRDAEALLLEVGFLLPHTAHARMQKLRGLLQRSLPSRAEVALLRGIVAQMRWASRHPDPGRTAQDH
ncbi:MAG: RNA methyltransferase [Synechococcaceae cyanobacterium]|nr:RNA methyltransferase [Synechococcaceae cyanobacterium]